MDKKYVKFCSFLNFLDFLITGRYSSLIDRILGIKLIYTNPKARRYLDFDLMNQTIVWNILANFLYFLLPFAVNISASSILNTIKKLFIMPSMLGSLE